MNADEVLLGKIDKAVAAVNEVEKRVETARVELVCRSKAVGELLLEAKKRHPKVADFEAFLKRVDGLNLSRAYDCMRIAGGRATDEEIRKDTRERVKKHRAKKKLSGPQPKPEPLKVSVTEPRVTESLEISAEQRRAENAALDLSVEAAKERRRQYFGTQVERSKQNLDWFAVACREYLPRITVEAHRQEARRLVAELTQAKVA